MSLEFSELRGCSLKYSNHFEIWQAWLDSMAAEPPVKFPSDWSIETSISRFLLLVENRYHNVTLRNCCFIVILTISVYTDHSNVTRATQRSSVDSPLGEPGFSTLASIVFNHYGLVTKCTVRDLVWHWLRLCVLTSTITSTDGGDWYCDVRIVTDCDSKHAYSG